MGHYRVADGCEFCLVAETSSAAYDLSSSRPEIAEFTDLARTTSVMGRSIDDIADSLITDASRIDSVSSSQSPLPPVVAEDVWAAGVTYRISEEARESESENPDVYQQIYDNYQPEIFSKSLPSRTVGPGEDVGIRSDSTWDVPEPELALVIYNGDIVGFTIGNDMSIGRLRVRTHSISRKPRYTIGVVRSVPALLRQRQLGIFTISRLRWLSRGTVKLSSKGTRLPQRWSKLAVILRLTSPRATMSQRRLYFSLERHSCRTMTLPYAQVIR